MQRVFILFLMSVFSLPSLGKSKTAPLVTGDRLAELIDCEHQRTVGTLQGSENPLLLEARIKEAQADIEYYQSRIESVQWLHAKSEVDTKYDQYHLDRMRKLHEKNAVPTAEVEDAERQYEHSQLNTRYINSRISELKAELKASEARLVQVQAILPSR